MTPTLKAPPRAKSILDAAFRYRPSHATDVRGTFERVHRGLAHRGWRGLDWGATAEGRNCGTRWSNPPYTGHAASH